MMKHLENCKYLSITIDFNLKRDKHLEYIIKKDKIINYEMTAWQKITKLLRCSTKIMKQFVENNKRKHLQRPYESSTTILLGIAQF